MKMKKILSVCLVLSLLLCLYSNQKSEASTTVTTKGLNKIFSTNRGNTVITVYGRTDGITLRNRQDPGIVKLNNKTYRFAENGYDSYLVKIKGDNKSIEIQTPECLRGVYKLSNKYYELTGKSIGNGTVTIINTKTKEILAKFAVEVHSEDNPVWVIEGKSNYTENNKVFHVTNAQNNSGYPVWNSNNTYSVSADLGGDYEFTLNMKDAYQNICMLSCIQCDSDMVAIKTSENILVTTEANTVKHKINLSFRRSEDITLKLCVSYVSWNDLKVHNDEIKIKLHII